MKFTKEKLDNKGFTLIELVVVIAILAVLALILIPSITGYVNKANDAKHQANARNIYTAATLVDKTEVAWEKEVTIGAGNVPTDEKTFQNELSRVVGKSDKAYKVNKTDAGFIVTIMDTNPAIIYPN